MEITKISTCFELNYFKTKMSKKSTREDSLVNQMMLGQLYLHNERK